MPIYTYRCDKCLMEFDVQHSMSEKREKCSEIEKSYNCTGNLQRALHVPLNTTPYVPPTGKDLEFRVRKGIEEAEEAFFKDRKKKMKTSEQESRERIKNGN